MPKQAASTPTRPRKTTKTTRAKPTPKTPKTSKRKPRATSTPRRLAVTFTTPERVLALDVSSRCVGWSEFSGGTLHRYGKFVVPGTPGHHGERLQEFRVWLARLLRDLEPTVLIYEAPYSGRMRHTFGVLSRYAGVVEALHWEHFGTELLEPQAVPARTVKRAIQAPKGKTHEENKRIVLRLVNERFGLSLRYKDNDPNKRVTEDDVADAIALNWAWHLLYRSEE